MKSLGSELGTWLKSWLLLPFLAMILYVWSASEKGHDGLS